MLETIARVVPIAAGKPINKTLLTISLSKETFLIFKVKIPLFLFFDIYIIKYSVAIRLDKAVAIAAPITSLPLGKITNMNNGSSIIFRMPPIPIPKLDSFEAPTDLTKCPSTLFKIVGIPPITTVIII